MWFESQLHLGRRTRNKNIKELFAQVESANNAPKDDESSNNITPTLEQNIASGGRRMNAKMISFVGGQIHDSYEVAVLDFSKMPSYLNTRLLMDMSSKYGISLFESAKAMGQSFQSHLPALPAPTNSVSGDLFTGQMSSGSHYSIISKMADTFLNKGEE